MSNMFQVGRSIVESFLRQHLNRKMVNLYLGIFHENLGFYRKELEKSGKQNGDAANIISFQIKNICRKINKDLHQYERIVVFIRLLEFVNEDNVITNEEYEIINIVAGTFKIDNTELCNLRSFIINRKTEGIEKDKLLVINNKETDSGGSTDEIKHIYREKLKGEITILFVQSINSYILLYSGSSNISLKGKGIIPGRYYFIHSGEIIRGSNIKPVYYYDILNKFQADQPFSKLTFTAKDIEYKFRNSENGIHSFSFSEESGQLIGIMGGSGVGKSTLLNLLNGNIIPLKGNIYINGYDLHKEKKKLEGLIGYVPQDDLLIEELTVYQNLYFNAKLCFGDHSEEKIKEIVEKVLIDFGLYEIRDLKVGNPLKKYISGGQRKRLNIGLELMREPMILFIDEPTSGLSSSDSEMVMQLLKRQTSEGKLVIANIHQPSSKIFKLFDKLWILDKGGFPVYKGNPVDAVVYFRTMSRYADPEESECPVCGNIESDQILQIIEAKTINEAGYFTSKRKVQPEKWYELYRSHIASEDTINENKKILPDIILKIPSLVKQFSIFGKRNLLRKLTNTQYLLINLLEAPVLSFILAYFTKYMFVDTYVFSENKNLPVFLFMSVVVALFMGLTVSAEEIIRDRKIIKRESFLNLSRFSYLNSKILFLFILSSIQTLSFILIGNYILEIKDMTLSFWFILFSTSCFANMVGLNISSGLNSVITIYISIPLILVPQLLLGGAMIKFDDFHTSITSKIHVPLIGDLMASRWAYEALMTEQFMNNRYEKIFFDHEKMISNATFKSSYIIPRLQSKLWDCINNRANNTNHEQTANNLELLKNEIRNMEIILEKPPFEYLNDLNISSFNEDIAEETNGYLNYLKFIFIDRSSGAKEKKEVIIDKITDRIGRDNFLKFKQKYHNKRISELVTNRDEINKIYEADNRLIQKKDPVFHYPGSNTGRSHFFAPVKKIYGYYFSTYRFNNLMIWIMTIILYLTLVFDVPGRVNTYLEGIRIRRAGR